MAEGEEDGMSEKEMCEWTYNYDEFWETQCGGSFVFTDGVPIENEFRFCPYCGKGLMDAGEDKDG